MKRYTYTLKICSGEGEQGTVEPYTGRRTVRAIKQKLNRERCGGDRWAHLLVEGQKMHDDYIEQWWVESEKEK